MSRAADEIERRMEAAGLETLHLIGLDLQGAAARDAPIDEGTLRGAGHSEIVATADGAMVVVSFSTPYAAKQEEEDDYLHPRGGKAHYLGDQLKARVPRYKAALAAAARRAIRGI